jgi:guanine deaminase
MEEEFMRRAIQLARNGMRARDGGPFGAVVVRDGEIIGEGWNRVLATHDPTGQPCPMCLGAIHWARISSIRYGFDITDAARLGFDDREFFRQFTLPAAARSIPETQLAREEALALAEEYLAMPGRRIY